MYSKLKFSWGHIIAFVGAIIYSYMTFVGLVYIFDGEFLLAGLVTLGILLLILFLFIGAQQVEATEEKFAKRIVWERILFWGGIPVFLLCSYPFMHTWHVQSNHSQVESVFAEAIGASTQVFSDYEAYAHERIDKYSALLDSEIVSHGPNYERLGFERGKERGQRNLQVETLHLLLLSPNYDTMKNKAMEWINNGRSGANVWNVFLIGNVKQIETSIEGWRNTLQKERFSGTVLKNESLLCEVPVFDNDGVSLSNAKAKLENLHKLYTEKGFPSIWGYPVLLLIYLSLIFPYLIQKRHPKNKYTLFGYQSWVAEEDKGNLKLRKKSESGGGKDKTSAAENGGYDGIDLW